MRVDELERELRAERQEPDPEFARMLDEWAAAGFPRGGEPHVDRDNRGKGAARGLGTRGSPLREPFARIFDRLRALPPRRILAPAGAAATLIVVAAVAISQRNELGGGADDVAQSLSTRPPADEDAGGAAGTAGGAAGTAGGQAARRAGEPAVPESLTLDDRTTVAPPPLQPPGGGGIAAGTDARIIDAAARITLGAEAEEVQEVANDVVEVTDRYQGIVSSSQVTTDQGGARASFELEIPFKQLDAALADLSELADVVSRTEGGEDITASAVRARRAIAETLEDIQQARARLIRTDDSAEQRIIRSRIRFLEATAAGQQTELAGVERQGRFATVGVEVTSNGGATEEGDWSLGDAAEDAVGVLTAVGGIALVSLAALVPLAALVAVAWLAVARARRAGRERALDR